jgi:hypothetical protein
MLQFNILVRAADGMARASALTMFNSEQCTRHGVLGQLESWRCRSELDRGVHRVLDGLLVESGRRVS